MRAFLGRWLRSLRAVFRRVVDTNESPWERVPMRVPASAFGPGSTQEFAHYFEGASGVPVESLDDIVMWLLDCEYGSDADLFNERDLWQHPSAFERLRRGDCEDFALWAWRKLDEVGIEAEFYVGRVCDGREGEAARQHAWVIYRVDGVDFLFEPAARSRTRMIHRLADVMDDYVPHFAVNRRFDTTAFAGCVLDLYRHRPFEPGPSQAA